MEENSNKYSIIIRIYNSEKYLSRQIDSIIKQTYQNWEVILIDDGSTDASGVICDEYEKKNRKIKVLHQKNSGCTCATVNGLKLASGDYCLVIDSDDWLDENLLQIVNKYLYKKEYDLLEYGLRIISNGAISKELSIVEEEKEFTQEEFFKFSFENTVHSICLKFIKRDSLSFTQKEIEILTNNKINQNEDMLICIPYIFSSKKIKVIPDCLYNYVLYNDSISHGIDVARKIQCAFETCDLALEFLEDRICLEKNIISLIEKELYREIFPVISSAIFRRKIRISTIKYLRKRKIFKYTHLFIDDANSIKKKLAWFLFRIV